MRLALVQRNTRLGSYEVLGPLDPGAAQPIFVARACGAEAEAAALFAVKAFEQTDDGGGALERIHTQMRDDAELNDPGVLPSRAVVAGAGHLHVISDLIRGDSLEHLLEAGAKPTRTVLLAIARELAMTLGRLHARGVVHGDVCPSTVMVGVDGRMLLREVGIARALAGSGLRAGGRQVGHASYMSLDRAMGRRDADKREDVYALGVILWELLTGTRAKARTELPPPSTLAKCGAELEAIVLRAIAPRREDRYADGGQLAEALDRYLTSRAPNTKLDAELVKLVSKHLAHKLRPRFVLLERWKNGQQSSRPTLPAPVPRRASANANSAAPVQSAAITPAQLFSELDLAVQDLGTPIDEPTPPPEVTLEPPASTGRYRVQSATALKAAAGDPPTMDVTRTGDLKPARRSILDLLGLLLLGLTLIVAFLTYLFSGPGVEVLRYWLR